MIKILVTGGTGFIGKQLVKALLAKKYSVTVISRQPALSVMRQFSNNVLVLPSISAIDPATLFDAVINLAGEGIMDKRWTSQRKIVLENSRIGLTHELVDLLERMPKRPKVLISSSAIGFYGTCPPTQKIDELSICGSDFSASLCARWEQAAHRAEELGLRVCIVRTGVVLHPDGGALKKMLPAFKAGLGGVIASGEQVISWIHRNDIVRILIYLLENQDMHSVYNATAPNPVNNREFTKALSQVLHRPALIPMPAAILRWLLGESSSLLIGGQSVSPNRLINSGFSFIYPDISSALAADLG
ncbi:MAG: TIGR01777 family oxidoreductase [Endozoicomonas sp. (ex Botrylloides leachii)]|nr:TIGR01777 family oxidoreductase [Endozoicomonas sp. (ex Botrylloides leachii)]